MRLKEQLKEMEDKLEERTAVSPIAIGSYDHVTLKSSHVPALG